MKIIKIKRGVDELSTILAKEINKALAQYNRVIWLVPGGSNVAISIEASKRLDSKLISKLVIMQTDERFVSRSSKDCNWKQLIGGGFQIKNVLASFPILTGEANLEKEAKNYDEIVKEQFPKADYVIGQFGVGVDAHICGIKPNSIASKSEDWVAGYQADDFKRITLTLKSLRKVNQALSFVFGENKLQALEKIKAGGVSTIEAPAEILNEIKDSVIYDDQIS